MDGEDGLTAEDKRESEMLVDSLACVLTHLSSSVTAEDAGAFVSRFHAVRAPSISLKDYLLRVNRYFHCSPACFVLALVYIDRAIKLHDPSYFQVDPLCVHRLILAAVVVAAKFFDDSYYSNGFYAKVGGIRVAELNALEVAFLDLLDWRLHVSVSEFHQYRNQVLLAVAGRTPSTLPGSPPLRLDEDDHEDEQVSASPPSPPCPGAVASATAVLLDEEGD